MSLQSIQNYCHQENFAGNTHIRCVPISWIDFYPEYADDGHNYIHSIDLLPGKDWLIFPCVAETLDFRERERAGRHGTTDTPTISAFLPGDTPMIASVLNSAKATEWVVVLYYTTGEAKVIGSPDYPARFTSTLNNRGNLNSGKGYTIEFFSEGDFKSFFLENPYVPPSGPCAPADVVNASSSPTYSDSVNSGGLLVLPTENISANGQFLLTKKSVEDINILVTDSQGNSIPVTPSNGAIQADQLPIPQDLIVSVPVYEDELFTTVKVVASAEGTINSINAGGLTGLVVQKNGGTVSVPFAILPGDVLTYQFDQALNDTEIQNIGTYA